LVCSDAVELLQGVSYRPRFAGDVADVARTRVSGTGLPRDVRGRTGGGGRGFAGARRGPWVVHSVWVWGMGRLQGGTHRRFLRIGGRLFKTRGPWPLIVDTLIIGS
jgi:hypothetical protein